MAEIKIEKELREVAKVNRKNGESDQAYFRRLFEAANTMSEPDWKSLSEETQKWVNAASKAVEDNDPIPNFEGEVAGTEEEPEAEGEAAASEGADEETEKETDKEDNKEKVVSKSKSKTTAKKKAATAKDKPAAKAKAPAKTTKKDAKDGGAKRGRKGAFGETDKITKVTTKNPFREGSKAAKCFKEYKVGRTVKAVLEAGVPRSKLNRHMSKGFVTIG